MLSNAPSALDDTKNYCFSKKVFQAILGVMFP